MVWRGHVLGVESILPGQNRVFLIRRKLFDIAININIPSVNITLHISVRLEPTDRVLGNRSTGC